MFGDVRKGEAKRFKLAGILFFIAVAFVIGVGKPFAGLSSQGHHIIAVIIVSLSMWIFRTNSLPYLGGCSVLLAGSLYCGVPFSAVMSGYTNQALWVLIPALFFGFALIHSGLGKRIAYFVLALFPPSYLTICLSWFIIGLVLSALTPSITVRLAIVMPIAMSIGEACGIPARSRGTALICFTAWGSALLPGIGWQTGSLWGIIMMGFYPAATKHLVTAGSWFAYMSVPWFIITVIFLTLLFIFMRPEKPLSLSREMFQEQYAALGKMEGEEIACGLILLCTFILFSTQGITGLRTVEIAFIALAALIFSGIIKLPDVSAGVNWDIINFLAVVLSLTTIFSQAGISAWAAPMIEDGIFSMAAHPLRFIIVATIIFWAIRFLDVPWGYTTIAFCSPLFVPLYVNFGLHPVLVTVVAIAAGNSFFLAYQQPFIMIAGTMTESRGWADGHVVMAGTLYAVAVIAGIFASYVYWRYAGLLPV